MEDGVFMLLLSKYGLSDQIKVGAGLSCLRKIRLLYIYIYTRVCVEIFFFYLSIGNFLVPHFNEECHITRMVKIVSSLILHC